jgi:hypothetical protein
VLSHFQVVAFRQKGRAGKDGEPTTRILAVHASHFVAMQTRGWGHCPFHLHSSVKCNWRKETDLATRSVSTFKGTAALQGWQEFSAPLKCGERPCCVGIHSLEWGWPDVSAQSDGGLKLDSYSVASLRTTAAAWFGVVKHRSGVSCDNA